jgi:hypothetical protein
MPRYLRKKWIDTQCFMQLHKNLPEPEVKPLQARPIAVDKELMRCIDLASVWQSGEPQRKSIMGMAITSSTASTVGTSQTGASAWQQRQQNFQALAQALNSGDLTAAKTAYAALTANRSGGGSGSAANNPNSPLAQLGQALQNGDLAGAQTAFSAMRSGHHHHSGATSASSTSNAMPTAPTPTLTTGNSVNTYA